MERPLHTSVLSRPVPSGPQGALSQTAASAAAVGTVNSRLPWINYKLEREKKRRARPWAQQVFPL